MLVGVKSRWPPDGGSIIGGSMRLPFQASTTSIGSGSAAGGGLDEMRLPFLEIDGVVLRFTAVLDHQMHQDTGQGLELKVVDTAGKVGVSANATQEKNCGVLPFSGTTRPMCADQ